MTKRLKSGSPVTIGTASPPGHVRTPTYLKGKRGVVVRDHGAWPNPEELAYGENGLPKKINYWVQFSMDELWSGKGDYGPNDTVCVVVAFVVNTPRLSGPGEMM